MKHLDPGSKTLPGRRLIKHLDPGLKALPGRRLMKHLDPGSKTMPGRRLMKHLDPKNIAGTTKKSLTTHVNVRRPMLNTLFTDDELRSCSR